MSLITQCIQIVKKDSTGEIVSLKLHKHPVKVQAKIHVNLMQLPLLDACCKRRLNLGCPSNETAKAEILWDPFLLKGHKCQAYFRRSVALPRQ